MALSTSRPSTQRFDPVIEHPDAKGRFIFVCEHASNMIPAEWGDLGLTAEQRMAHIAWDPGALAVSRKLAELMDSVVIHAPVSRLVYDCNRAPDKASAMPETSEIYDVSGNRNISSQERLRRTEAVYLPWANGLHNLIAGRIALGLRPVIVTVHSFTPVYQGKQRHVEFGVIHDNDLSLAVAIQAAASKHTRLHTKLNAPYSAADDVTHTLRAQALPYGLPNAMLELRNDLIATKSTQNEMAELLAPILNMGLVEIQRQAKAS